MCLVDELDSLEWPVMVLAQVGAEFTVESPSELIEMTGATARLFGRAAAQPR